MLYVMKWYILLSCSKVINHLRQGYSSRWTYPEMRRREHLSKYPFVTSVKASKVPKCRSLSSFVIFSRDRLHEQLSVHPKAPWGPFHAQMPANNTMYSSFSDDRSSFPHFGRNATLTVTQDGLLPRRSQCSPGTSCASGKPYFKIYYYRHELPLASQQSRRVFSRAHHKMFTRTILSRRISTLITFIVP